MLQRIQSIYLFLAGLTSFIYLWMPYWEKGELSVAAKDNVLLLLLAIITMSLSILTIFLYKNRPRQILFCRLNIGVLLILMLITIFLSYQIDHAISLEGMYGAIGFPFIAIILCTFAIRAIKRDENLVRSADRFRE